MCLFCFIVVGPEPNSCKLKESDLIEGTKVLARLDAHFHRGKITAITPPDVYGILKDKDRGNKPYVFSRSDLLQETVSLNI